jgi:RimJ/RimL family protein N-acetyltransferase
MSQIVVELLSADQWQRAKSLRLASLGESPHAIGGDLESESAQSETEWRAKFEKLHYLIASVEGIDCAIMTIENLAGEFGAKAWIGACWSSPQYRAIGLLRAMMKYVDQHALEKGWQRQGLFVLEDNELAIAVYERLGFIAMGEPMLSTKFQGKFKILMIRDAAPIS